MDSDTKQTLLEGEKLKLLTEHEGWGIAYDKFSAKILELQYIGNVDDSTPEKALIDMKARKLAVEVLMNWMKNDILGTVEQFNTNNTLQRPVMSYIVRQEG
jgi:hypothetical protein